MWFCGLYYGAFHVESCLALCSRVFFLGLSSPRFGTRELIYVLILHFVLFILHTFVFVPFSSSLASGLAAAFDCGTAWTLLLTWLRLYKQIDRLCIQLLS